MNFHALVQPNYIYIILVCWVWKRPHETVWQYWPGVSWLWNPFKSRNDVQMGNTDTQYSTSCRYTRKCQNQWYLGHLRPSASRKDCCVCRLILVASSLCFWHWQWSGPVKFQDCQTYVTLHPSTLEPNINSDWKLWDRYLTFICQWLL